MQSGQGTSLACPQFNNSGCCTPQQNEYLTFNFFLIRAQASALPSCTVRFCVPDVGYSCRMGVAACHAGTAFGGLGDGGTPACAQNLMNWWCEYTCSPNQVSRRVACGPDPRC